MPPDRTGTESVFSADPRPLWGHAAAFAPLSSEAYLSLGSMEGMDDRPFVELRPAAPRAVEAARRAWAGFLAAGAITALSYAIHYLPVAPFRLTTDSEVRRPISAAIIAILLGLLGRNLFQGGAACAAGCKVIVRRVLPGTIILTGAGLNLLTLAKVGLPALCVVILCIVVATIAGYGFGRWFGLRKQTALLIGAGTAICGNSAIVAVAPLVEAEDEDLVLSIATVNLFGMLAMLALPLVGGLMHMGHEAFGVLAGSTVHSVPQAVAAGFAYGPEAGALATLVKLVRVTLLAPLVFLLAVHYARTHRSGAGPGQRPAVHFARLVPWFVWGFLATSVLNTLGLIPSIHFALPAMIWSTERSFEFALSGVLSDAGTLLLTLAMAAIGLELDIRMLAGTGGRAVAVGLLATVAIVAASLMVIRVVM